MLQQDVPMTTYPTYGILSHAESSHAGAACKRFAAKRAQVVVMHGVTWLSNASFLFVSIAHWQCVWCDAFLGSGGSFQLVTKWHNMLRSAIMATGTVSISRTVPVAQFGSRQPDSRLVVRQGIAITCHQANDLRGGGELCTYAIHN